MARRRCRRPHYPTITPNPKPNQYREENDELDMLMKEITVTLEGYQTCTEEDEYEIPPGFEVYSVSNDVVRCYYGVYCVNDEGEIMD